MRKVLTIVSLSALLLLALSSCGGKKKAQSQSEEPVVVEVKHITIPGLDLTLKGPVEEFSSQLGSLGWTINSKKNDRLSFSGNYITLLFPDLFEERGWDKIYVDYSPETHTVYYMKIFCNNPQKTRSQNSEYSTSLPAYLDSLYGEPEEFDQTTRTYKIEEGEINYKYSGGSFFGSPSVDVEFNDSENYKTYLKEVEHIKQLNKNETTY